MVTIKDVSKLSGYSVTTVSKALNNYPDIARKTKEHIKKICNEVGYVPNATAQSLVSKKSYTIGIIFEEITGVGLQHPLFSKILESFKAEVEKLGYDIMFLSNTNTSGNIGSYYQHSLRKQVEAILVLCAEFNSEEMVELYKGTIPTVIIDYNNEQVLNVTSSNQIGMRQAVEYLTQLNHKKIGHIHGSLDTYIGELRYRYFREAMVENNQKINEDYLVDGNFFSREDGIIAMNKILALDNPPTAIVCASDMLAIGAINACKKDGRSVPDDFSIIGFDGINAGQLISPTLTTIKQNTEAMGKTAAKNIIKMIGSKKQLSAGKTIEVPTAVLVGETTRKI